MLRNGSSSSRVNYGNSLQLTGRWFDRFSVCGRHARAVFGKAQWLVTTLGSSTLALSQLAASIARCALVSRG